MVIVINSLSLAVWDADRRRGLSLKERIEMFSEREASLYCEDWEGGVRHDVFFVSFNECGEPAMKVARTVRLSGENVFMLLVGERGGDITPFFRPVIRPDGVLFRPIKNAELRDILEEITSEMERLAQDGDDTAFILKAEGVSYRVPFRDILFFEANNKKVQLHTTGQEIGYYDSLENLAAMLPETFVRCHRSYLVNTLKVEEMHGATMELRLTGGYRVPLSRSYREAVKQALMQAQAAS